MSDIVKRLRLLEADHPPDGWPAVQMRDITALLDEVERLAADDITWRSAQKACEHCAPDIAADNRKLAADNRKLVRVLQASVSLVCGPTWGGDTANERELERVLRECGYVEPPKGEA